MSKEPEVLQPRDDTDRTLLRRAQVRLFMSIPNLIDYLLEVIRDENEKTSDRNMAARLLLERCLPKLESVDVRAIVADLSPATDAQLDEFSQQRRAAVLSLIETARARQNGAA